MRRTPLTQRIGQILFYLGIAFFVLFALFPYIWTALTSFKPESELFTKGVHYLPKDVVVQNYINLFKRLHFQRYLSNSLIVAVSTTALALVISSLAGYAFSRFRFNLRAALMVIFVLTNMFPKILLIIPLFMIFRHVSLLNTYHGLVLAHCTFTIPFATWMLTGFFDSIPRELEEAAMVDGASRIRAFLKVTLPLAAPSLAATAVYIFIHSWNDYLYAVMFTSSESVRTLPIALKMFIGKYEVDWGALTAGGIVTSVPLVVFFMLVQRYLIAGLTAGAVKQ
ncbi:ABC transporter permease subunit [candidate division KSB3 bacterium]|uniref:ABC transporter permease subunit n=1 Tax=candidate division KSB3 bacterium TaxID=2044937 RepID=A0A9D5Q4K6_9BACT|nr:ABC transporter permease subunit [candidate division KSB3 bacterium]MBD3323292.1 ABC transporter permease subunit [candidate division KSB3 bacterium]